MIAKAELHCHLEGSIAPPLALKLAERNGLSLPDGLMRADGTYEWRDFLGFLAAYDTDAFVRWESGQQYATQVLLAQIER